MKTININRLCFLLVIWIYSSLISIAQNQKRLLVEKVHGTTSAKTVPALLDKEGVKWQSISAANWPSYPYKPDVQFRISHTGKSILLQYKVKEDGIRAMTGKDFGSVWRDSCVEFFVAPDGDSCYYNIECNCIGYILIEYGPADKRSRAEQKVANMIKRWSSLGHSVFDTRKEETEWTASLIIPAKALFKHNIKKLDGIKMRGNFYKCGNQLPKPHFLSWNPILTDKVQFHCPEFFGELDFE